MHIDTVRTEEHSTISLSGEMDVNTSPDVLAAALAEAHGDCTLVRLDLAGVSFIDSVGLSVLIRIQHELTHDSLARLVLLNPSDRVESLLDLTAIRSHFEILD